MHEVVFSVIQLGRVVACVTKLEPENPIQSVLESLSVLWLGPSLTLHSNEMGVTATKRAVP